jgi:hypothetical protein
MEKIRRTGYKGAVTLEPMNWDYTDIGIKEFLTLAYVRARRLEELINL